MIGRLVRDEQGVALVLAVVTMLVLSSLTASVLFSVAVNHRSAAGSAHSDKAFALAENGLAFAEGRLYSAATSGESPLVPLTTFSQDGGTVSYRGTLSGQTWTLTGTGTYQGKTRTVTAQAVVPQAQTIVDANLWNYMYADSKTTCLTIANNAAVNVPLYTQGSVCMGSNATFTGSDLEVGGNLTLGTNATIGTKAKPISKLNVVGSCTPAPCDGSHAPIWVNVPGVGHALTPYETKPVIDLPGMYSATNPGPLHACQTGSGVPTNFFDNNTTLNKSNGTINLFPAGSNYDCKIGTNEIKWNAAASTLLVNGAFYFDGNLSLTSKTVIYSGKGTLYFTGTITMNNNGRLCGIASCTGQWDPSVNVLVLVAGCWANATGSSLVSHAGTGTYCVSYNNNGTSQVGTYAVTDADLSNNGINWGPVIADTINLSNNATQMLPIHSLPPGAPQTVQLVDQPPQATTNWSG